MAYSFCLKIEDIIFSSTDCKITIVKIHPIVGSNHLYKSVADSNLHFRVPFLIYVKQMKHLPIKMPIYHGLKVEYYF